MATATVSQLKAARLPRWAIVSAYLAVLLAAEVLISVQDPTDPTIYPDQQYGLALHVLLIFALLFHSVFILDRDRTLATLLTALSLAPLIRIFSLSVPHFDFSILQWLAIVSVPLLLAVGAVAYVQGLRLRDLGLLLEKKAVPVQTAIALTGLPLGVVEYAILKPAAWPTAGIVGGLVTAFVIILLATGLSEELAFRGIMLRRAVEGLGQRGGLLFVTLVFASLHIFYRNAADLAFVFLVGLFYGVVVLRTKSLWGVVISHTLDNVLLYLLAPNLFPSLP